MFKFLSKHASLCSLSSHNPFKRPTLVFGGERKFSTGTSAQSWEISITPIGALVWCVTFALMGYNAGIRTAVKLNIQRQNEMSKRVRQND